MPATGAVKHPANVQPGGHLTCVGKFQANAHYNEKQYSFSVYVIRSLTANNLLGRDKACAMGQVKRIEEVHNAFGKHGTLKTDPVKILLKEKGTPASHTEGHRGASAYEEEQCH